MLLHVPLVVALAVAALFLHRKGAMKPAHGLACGAFGFCLAGSSFAGSIQSASAGILGMIGQIGF
jgi:hypothetical protein